MSTAKVCLYGLARSCNIEMPHDLLQLILSIYLSFMVIGTTSKDDEWFVTKLLSVFVNKQSALFQHWIRRSYNTLQTQLLILTPFKIICVPTAQSPKGMKQVRIIHIVSLFVEENKKNGKTNNWLYHCSIKFHKLDVSEMSYDINNVLDTDILDIYFECVHIAKDFLHILQFYLFSLYRGVPIEYKPKIEIIPNALNVMYDKYIADGDNVMETNKNNKNITKYPFIPSQVFIDRYVAFCDAQKIAALESVIDYVIHRNDNDTFDVAAAFTYHRISSYRHSYHYAVMDKHEFVSSNDTKHIQQQQYVALFHALAFLKKYKKLSIDRLKTDDCNIATLMKIFETNRHILSCEFRKCAIKKLTMQSLSISLSSGVANLEELSIIDINISGLVLKDLIPGLESCNLTKLVMSKCNMSEKTIIYLFSSLLNTEQYKTMQHLNISYNHCDKEGSKELSLFLYKSLNLHTLIVNDARIDGNIFFNGLHFKSHLHCLSYLDFSGNVIGEKGVISVSNFLQSAKALHCLKLSRCNMSTQQLHKIFEGALANNCGLQHIHGLTDNDRPTRCDIIQCRNLLRLTLDISYNNLGRKGANTLCQLLKNRLLTGNIANYTIVSLCLAGNNFDVINLSNIVQNLHCCICLESLNISNNIKQNIFTNNITKLTKSKHNDINEGLLGKCLVDLCRKATNLERLILNNSDLSIGLEPFLKSIAYLSNLKFVDISNNKLNDKHISLLITSLSYNRTFIRSIKIGGNNKISSQCLIEYLQLLSNHTSLIDVNNCLPIQHILKYIKVKKYSATFTRLQSEASLNLRDNKCQYDIDKKMEYSLPIRERLERILRLQCGEQFGIPLESIRGSIKFVDYASRIPKILVFLRNYLKSKGGFKTREIFRLHANCSQFDKFKQDLNANNKDAKTNHTHCIANAIKAFYGDLPIKVLNNVNINILQSVSSTQDVVKVIKLIKEPYQSLFEWLLDLCVDIINKQCINKMSDRSMAVIFSPLLYNACTATPKILRSVMQFTDYAIKWRRKYRNKYPAKYNEEMLLLSSF